MLMRKGTKVRTRFPVEIKLSTSERIELPEGSVGHVVCDPVSDTDFCSSEMSPASHHLSRYVWVRFEMGLFALEKYLPISSLDSDVSSS